MKLLSFLSSAMLPFLVLYILTYGLYKRVNCYEVFTRGAKEGIHTAGDILPTLIGLMAGVAILRDSGFLDWFSDKISRFTAPLGLPAELVPLSVVRLFSGSAAVSLLTDIYSRYGADSRLGYIASLLMCSTETVFYTMSLYLIHVRIRKSRFILPGALLCVLAATAASIWLGSRM
jgi:spore maturation protein B